MSKADSVKSETYIAPRCAIKRGRLDEDIHCEDANLTLKKEHIPIPFGWKVIIKVDPKITKTKSGIILADESQSNDKYYKSSGRVIAIGDTAFCNRHTGEQWAGNWPSVGDHVSFARFGGKEVTIDGVELLVLQDEDVTIGIPEDAIVRSYVNGQVMPDIDATG